MLPSMDAPGVRRAVVEIAAALDADRDAAVRYRAAGRALLRATFLRLAELRGGLPRSTARSALLAEPAATLPVVALAIVDQVREPDDLGIVYESLLGWTGTSGADGGFAVVPTSTRRQAGAHYTPRALAEEVVEHALEPLTCDAGGLRPSAEILDLRIADITAGSGAFLLAAARYLAGRLEAGGPGGLAQVIGTCLYGADLDPDAVEICTLSLWLLAGDPDLPLDFLAGRVVHGNALVEESASDDARWKPVAWRTLAPEVFASGGFDAVVGNPPFLGVKSIRDVIGRELRDHLADSLLAGESGRSDLAIFFLAQAGRLSRNVVALVLPDAVWEGDSYVYGIERARADGFQLYRADTSRPWPSDAGVRIALVWLSKSEDVPGPVLDGVPVAAIAPRRSRTSARDRPTWMPHGFQASIVLGKSLLLTRDQAAEMIAEDARAERLIRDYLSGDDIVSTLGPTSTRQVLDLGAADLESLLAISPIARRLHAVRAERDAQLSKYPQLANRWWGFLNRVDRLYDELAGLEEAIAFTKHAKYTWPVLVPTGPIFSNGVIVYPTADRSVYGFLASTAHRIWATQEGGSRLNQSHRYNPSRLLRTYPFPESIESVRPAGEALAVAVAAAQEQLGLGITELLNLVHGDSADRVIADLRAAIARVDRAVLDAHGFDDADPDPGRLRDLLVAQASR